MVHEIHMQPFLYLKIVMHMEVSLDSMGIGA